MRRITFKLNTIGNMDLVDDSRQGVPQIVLGEAEEIRVPNGADVRGSSISGLVADYVENADLAKDAAVAQGDKHRHSVVGHHTQPAAFHDVHLLSDVSLSANVVTRRENLRPMNLSGT